MSSVSDTQIPGYFILEQRCTSIGSVADAIMAGYREDSTIVEELLVDLDVKLTHSEISMLVVELADRLAKEKAVRSKAMETLSLYAGEVGRHAEGLL